MEIAFLHDTNRDYIGGAELSNQKIIEQGIALGHRIVYDSLKDKARTFSLVSDVDFVILSNTFFCTYEKDLFYYLLEHNIRYVRYEHDYGFCGLRNIFCSIKPEIKGCCHPEKYNLFKKIFSHSLINVFLSPLHYERHQSFFGDCVRNYFLLPPPLITSSIKNYLDKNNVVCFPSSLTYEKGGHELLSFARENPQLKIDVYGEQKMDIPIPENVNIKGVLPYEELLDVLGSTKYCFVKPLWIEPSGRVAAEAFLSGCEIIGNKNVGFFSFPFYPDNKKEAIRQIEDAPNLFWEKVMEAFEKKKTKPAHENWGKVLVFKSYGGLGDVFISLPAVYKLNEVSLELTYAVSYGLAPLFKENISEFKIMDSEKLESIDFSDYDKVIDLANYPSFTEVVETDYAISYPTHHTLRQHAALHYINGVSLLHPNINIEFGTFPFFKIPIKKGNYFTIHPGAGFRPKCWPEDRFLELVYLLLNRFKEYDCKIILGPEDKELVIKDEYEDRISFVQENICQVGIILGNAIFHVGNDSGISHMAGLYNVPVVTIHGPSGPGTWSVLSEHKKVIWGKWKTCDIPCNFNTATTCEHRICLNSVTVKKVLDETLDLLDELNYEEQGCYFMLNPNTVLEIKNKQVIIKTETNEFLLELEEEKQIRMLEELKNGGTVFVEKISEKKYELIHVLNGQKIVLKNPDVPNLFLDSKK